MDVTALFDDVDTAEHALVNLQSLGIFPSRYKIRALHIPGERGRGTALTGIGGSLSNVAGGGSEGPSREVQLLMSVEDPVGPKAQSALISNHGRRVRSMPETRTAPY